MSCDSLDDALKGSSLARHLAAHYIDENLALNARVEFLEAGMREVIEHCKELPEQYRYCIDMLTFLLESPTTLPPGLLRLEKKGSGS